MASEAMWVVLIVAVVCIAAALRWFIKWFIGRRSSVDTMTGSHGQAAGIDEATTLGSADSEVVRFRDPDALVGTRSGRSFPLGSDDAHLHAGAVQAASGRDDYAILGG